MKKNYLETYHWKWVCVQHPMILLSGDMSQPRALETVEPWGAGDIPGYCHKMYEVLKKMDESPEMKADFDMSAKEVMIFFEHEPEGKALMKKLYEEGKLGITGTDYSQSHFGTARSESSLREIRMGAEIFEKELGIVTDTFCRQEMGLFENLPQLLKAFGVTKSACFRFPVAFEYLELPTLEMISSHGRLSFVNHETMANWCGLDGTCIPMYMPLVDTGLTQDFEAVEVFKSVSRPEFLDIFPGSTPIVREYPMESEEVKGMYRNGSIVIQVPDLIEVDDDYLKPRLKTGSLWRLTDALDEEMKHVTKMPKIHYYTYWSYAEGGFGEQMFKIYRACEEKLLAAESLQAIAAACGLPFKFDAYSAWDKLLTAQHHDINWVDHKELRGRAVQWCEEAEDMAVAFISQVGAAIAEKLGEQSTKEAVAVFNTLPITRTAYVKVPVQGEGYCVFDDKGCELPAQMDDDKLIIQVTMDGLGCCGYRLEEAEIKAEKIVQQEAYQFENDVMRVTVLPDGRLTSLYSKKRGEQLEGYGNVVSGRLIYDENKYRVISNEGAAKEMMIIKGALYDKVLVQGMIEDIPYAMTIRLPHGNSSEITFDLDLAFNSHEIGDMVHDESKLNLYWNLSKEPEEILIDEPFGYTKARPNRPLLVANFLTAWNGKDGVMFQHSGMPKSWISGNQLVTQLAWGSDIIFNRMPFFWNSMQYFDMRLDGAMHYSYAISIVEDTTIPAMFEASNNRTTSLVAVPTTQVFSEKTLLKLNTNALVPTAVEEKNGEITVRMYEISGKCTTISYNSCLTYVGKTDVAGKTKDGTDCCNPYEIFEMKFH